MVSKIIPVEGKINTMSVLSKGKTLANIEDVSSVKKLNVLIKDTITSPNTAITRETLATDSAIISGKITQNNEIPILGVIEEICAANTLQDVITTGAITENSLSGGSVGQEVYVNSTGQLTLTKSGLSVGRLITTSEPIKVFINAGREYDENQELLLLDRSSLYLALRYLSYFLPIETTKINDPAYGSYLKGPSGSAIKSGPFPATSGKIIYSDELELYVAVYVGLDGLNYSQYSSDGNNWQFGNLLSGLWQAVVYGNGRFVAVGFNSTHTLAYSLDGANWIHISSPQLNSWEDIAYGNNIFVAISSDGTNRVMTSLDGINWTLQNAIEANQWKSIIFKDGVFYCCAASGTNRIMVSNDGINWSSLQGVNNFNGVLCYGNGIFIASATANHYISEDNCVTWATCPGGGSMSVYDNLNAVFYNKFGNYRTANI